MNVGILVQDECIECIECLKSNRVFYVLILIVKVLHFSAKNEPFEVLKYYFEMQKGGNSFRIINIVLTLLTNTITSSVYQTYSSGYVSNIK